MTAMDKALGLFVGILLLHWFADFFLQTHWQSINKSKRFDALFLHVCTYSLTLMVASVFLFGRVASGADVYRFVAFNAALHFLTDFATSRWTSRLWQKAFPWGGRAPVVTYPPPDGAMHNFFVVVGFDQFLHHAALAATFAVFILPR